jgi:hypothetical protein
VRRAAVLFLALVTGCAFESGETPRFAALEPRTAALWTLGDEAPPHGHLVVWTGAQSAASMTEVVVPIPGAVLTGRVESSMRLDDGSLFLSGSLEHGGDWSALWSDDLFSGTVRTGDGRVASVRAHDRASSFLRLGRRHDVIRCVVPVPPPGATAADRRESVAELPVDCIQPRPSSPQARVRLAIVYPRGVLDELGLATAAEVAAFGVDVRAKALEAAAVLQSSCHDSVRLVVSRPYPIGVSTDAYVDLETMRLKMHEFLDAISATAVAPVLLPPKLERPPGIECADLVLVVHRTEDDVDGVADPPESLLPLTERDVPRRQRVCVVRYGALLGEDGTAAVQHLAAHEIGHLFGCGHQMSELGVPSGALTRCSHGAYFPKAAVQKHGTVETIGITTIHGSFSEAGKEIDDVGTCADWEDNVHTIYLTAPILARIRD